MTAVVLGCFVLGLPGCAEPGPEQALDTYLDRIATTLALDSGEVTVVSSPKPPKISDLRLTLPPANLGTLDFLSLTGCAVQITIGKRNSSLGLFASDSQRLLLDLEYLQLAPQCIDFMRQAGRRELADLLQDAFVLKREQLPGLIFNATLGNTEFRQFWKKPQTLNDYPRQTSSAVLSALAAINLHVKRWLSGDFQANNKAFEILLSEIARGDGGALLQALAIQESRLEAGNTLLRQSLTRGPLCAPRYRHDGADTLPQVIKKYFIAEVQPWSASLGRRYHELLPPLIELEEVLFHALPESYNDWRQIRQKAFLQLISAPREHVELLEKVLSPCQEK